MQDTVLQLQVPTKGLAIYLVIFFAVPTLHSEVQGAALSVLPHVFDSNALHVHVLHIKYKPSPTAAKGTLSRCSGPCAALGCRLFTGTLSPAKSMQPLARVILFKYVAIVLNQCLTETAGNSPGHLREGGKVKSWCFNKQGRLVPLGTRTTREAAKVLCVLLEDFRALFSFGIGHKKQWDFPTFPTELLLS